MKSKFLLLGLLFVLLKPVSAQSLPTSTPNLSLKEAITYALANSQEIAKAEYDEEIGLNQIREVKGTGLPQLNASGKLEYYPSLPTQILPGIIVGQPGTDIPVQFGKEFNVSGGLQLTQLLFNQSFFVGLQAARSTQDLYRLRKEMAQEDVVYNVSSAYLLVLQTQDQFAIIDANLERLNQLEKILQLQYENDLVRKVDVNRVRVNRSNLENQRQTLFTALEQSKNYLKFFMGMPLSQEIVLKETEGLDLELVPSSLAAINTEQKIEFQLLNKSKELTEFQIKSIAAGYYPSLSAFGNYSYLTQRNELFDSEIPWFKTAVVGVQLNIPIFDGFQKRSRIRMAQLEMKKIEEDIELLNTNTKVEVANAISQLENSLRSIEEQKKIVALAQEVYDTSNQLYKEGIAPLTDLLEAEVSLREAQTNLNNEQLKYQLAQLNYLKAAGEIANLTTK